MLKQFKVSINEIYLEDFLKVTVLNHSSKEQQSDPFIKHPVHSLILAEKEQKWMLKPMEYVLMKFTRKTFSK